MNGCVVQVLRVAGCQKMDGYEVAMELMKLPVVVQGESHRYCLKRWVEEAVEAMHRMKARAWPQSSVPSESVGPRLLRYSQKESWEALTLRQGQKDYQHSNHWLHSEFLEDPR